MTARRFFSLNGKEPSATGYGAGRVPGSVRSGSHAQADAPTTGGTACAGDTPRSRSTRATARAHDDPRRSGRWQRCD